MNDVIDNAHFRRGIYHLEMNFLPILDFKKVIKEQEEDSVLMKT